MKSTLTKIDIADLRIVARGEAALSDSRARELGLSTNFAPFEWAAREDEAREVLERNGVCA